MGVERGSGVGAPQQARRPAQQLFCSERSLDLVKKWTPGERTETGRKTLEIAYPSDSF